MPKHACGCGCAFDVIRMYPVSTILVWWEVVTGIGVTS
jgi:hypothetical protein